MPPAATASLMKGMAPGIGHEEEALELGARTSGPRCIDLTACEYLYRLFAFTSSLVHGELILGALNGDSFFFFGPLTISSAFTFFINYNILHYLGCLMSD